MIVICAISPQTFLQELARDTARAANNTAQELAARSGAGLAVMDLAGSDVLEIATVLMFVSTHVRGRVARANR